MLNVENREHVRMISSSSLPTIDQIMMRVNEEAERRRNLSPQAPNGPPPRLSDLQLVPAKSQYALSDFLQFKDEAFIRAAYQGLLKRNVDQTGIDNHLLSLRSGQKAKTDILIDVRWSPEGRKHGVKVPGLNRLRWWRYATKVPVLGPALIWLSALSHASQLRRDIRRLDAGNEQVNEAWRTVADRLPRGEQDLQEGGDVSSSAPMRIQRSVSDVLRQVAEHRRRQEAGLTRAETNLAALKQWCEDQEPRLHEIETRLDILQSDFLANQRRLMSVLETRLGHGAGAAVGVQEPYDGFFAPSTNLFWSDDDYRERFALYDPLMARAGEAAGCKRVLELGYTDGKYLDLLSTAGFEPTAVPCDGAARDRRQSATPMVEGDPLSELLRLPDATFAAVLAFRLLERLPFGTLVRIIDETLRILRPGGTAIFEALNPRNILGACDFYRDPARRNPVFPDTLAVLGRARGFCESRIVFIDIAGRKLIPAEEWSFTSLQDYVNVPRNYAWIGTKAQ